MKDYSDDLKYLKDKRDYFQKLEFTQLVEDYTKAIKIIEDLIKSPKDEQKPTEEVKTEDDK